MSTPNSATATTRPQSTHTKENEYEPAGILAHSFILDQDTFLKVNLCIFARFCILSAVYTSEICSFLLQQCRNYTEFAQCGLEQVLEDNATRIMTGPGDEIKKRMQTAAKQHTKVHPQFSFEVTRIARLPRLFYFPGRRCRKRIHHTKTTRNNSWQVVVSASSDPVVGRNRHGHI